MGAWLRQSSFEPHDSLPLVLDGGPVGLMEPPAFAVSDARLADEVFPGWLLVGWTTWLSAGGQSADAGWPTLGCGLTIERIAISSPPLSDGSVLCVAASRSPAWAWCCLRLE